jgi:hypothetical protein
MSDHIYTDNTKTLENALLEIDKLKFHEAELLGIAVSLTNALEVATKKLNTIIPTVDELTLVLINGFRKSKLLGPIQSLNQMYEVDLPDWKIEAEAVISLLKERMEAKP